MGKGRWLGLRAWVEAAATAVLRRAGICSGAGPGRDRHHGAGGRQCHSGFPGAGSRCRDGHCAYGGARLFAGPRWLLQDADRRIRARRGGRGCVSRHRAETRWLAVFRDGGVRAVGRGGIARRKRRGGILRLEFRLVFSIASVMDFREREFLRLNRHAIAAFPSGSILGLMRLWPLLLHRHSGVDAPRRRSHLGLFDPENLLRQSWRRPSPCGIGCLQCGQSA
jgi:hypothetical protein